MVNIAGDEGGCIVCRIMWSELYSVVIINRQIFRISICNQLLVEFVKYH